MVRITIRSIYLHRFFQQEDSDPFLNMPDYFTVELDLWSMADLMAVKKGSFHDVIRFVKQCDEHVKQCEVRTIVARFLPVKLSSKIFMF